ncbi:MAG TPA: hypothetical protein VG672_28540, partial [Bryobacteraceae bacterium]|nr:hypothetical protein [Bryobacteraceae bacterium]
KGSWIMHMLRRQMGDQRFQSMLAAICKRYAHASISTAQFQKLAVEFLPPGSPDPKLENFFEQWVYGTGIPAIKLSWSVKGKAPALRVTGKVTQSDVAEDFTAAVPVEISFSRAKPVTHWVRTSSDPVTFQVAVRQVPAKVILDPGLSVLRQ